jgi:RNA polymerase sigma-70 factor (ECF subfamily)
MSTQNLQNSFEKIYNETYDDVLNFIIFKCNNLDDANDIIQETYLELFKMMNKQEIHSIKPFIIGIAKNKLKKYYGFKKNIRNLFVSKNMDDKAMVETLGDNFNLETQVFEKISTEEIWTYLRKKNIKTAKIFYLHYAEDVTLKEIANTLNLNESTVKNHLYRTLKELNTLFGKDCD